MQVPAVRLRLIALALAAVALMTFARPAEAVVASVVVDAATGTVLHAHNADREHHPASLTKMMTLYLAFDAIKLGRTSLDTSIRVSRQAAQQPPSRLGIAAGGRITVRNAIDALIVRSANDVATALAEHLAGSERAFAEQMTAKARDLGMTRTVFRNAHGLHHPEQVTTARDMAVLALALLRHHGNHYARFGAREFRFNQARHRSHNHLLRNYSGADGMKTGYIRAAGFNLAASAVRDGRRIVAVALGGDTAAERDAHMVRLLDAGFQHLQRAGALTSTRARAGVPGIVAARIAPGTSIRAAAVAPAPIVPRARPGAATIVAASAPVAPRARPDEMLFAAADLENAPLVLPRPRPEQDEEEIALVAEGSAETPQVNSGWSIQVGAFARRDDALRVAEETLTRLADLPDHAQAIVSSFRQRSGRVVYRSRIVGVDRAIAQGACRALTADRRDCLVVREEQRASTGSGRSG